MPDRRIIAAALTLACLLSCSTKEGPVAPWLGGLPGQGSQPLSLVIDSADAETTFARVVPLGGGAVLFVGRDGGYEAHSLLRFALVDTTVQSYGESRLTLTLQVGQDDPVWFRLYRVRQFWNESVVTWERANTDSTGDLLWDSPGGVVFPLTIAEAGPCSLHADTSRVTFVIPAAVTRQIYEERAENYGFMVRLDDEGFSQSLWRFNSREAAVTLRPQWEVSFVDTAGNDTTRVLYAAADASIARRVAPVAEDRLLVGSGVGYRMLIHFPLPDVLDSTVTINYATLYLYCDTTQALLETKSLQVELIDSIWRGDSTAVMSPYVNQSLVVPGVSEVSFNISSAVKEWVARAIDNNGFQVRFSAEDNAVAFCPFFPIDGPAGLTPRIEIDYSVPPLPPGGYAPASPGGTPPPAESSR
ncbi:DNRLRE domain-containing protein [Candidatus Fermentibacteria bacterium]|nr:DNRLRE domain-containing protein [Candidatus Fermentibacteria bacterium]